MQYENVKKTARTCIFLYHSYVLYGIIFHSGVCYPVGTKTGENAYDKKECTEAD